MILNSRIENFYKRYNNFSEKYFSMKNDCFPYNMLNEPMKYIMFAPGKRLRPLLVYELSSLVSLDLDIADKIALSVELIHCYSLVHDDLPALDNDDYRRNQLTCHKKYSEATAILTGNSLLTEAISILATIDNVNINKIILYVTDKIGSKGMMLGQMHDLYADIKSEEDILYRHTLKTSYLFQISSVLPIICVNKIEHIVDVESFAENFGIAFQIINDLNAKADLNKKTFKSMFSRKECIDKINYYKKNSIEKLSHVSDTTQHIAQLVNSI